jgi:hypothetical protein
VASRVAAFAGCALAVTAIAGCGSSSSTSQVTAASAVSASDLNSYIAAVEKVRLPVNTLLNDADPILDAYKDHKITPRQASKRFDAMEETFAGYARNMQLITPADPTLQALNAPYAHTYFLEDSYLATLASDLREGDFDNLPNTQGAQRLAIIEWRIQLETLAARLHVSLPGDIQHAGRGEIAPAIDGS